MLHLNLVLPARKTKIMLSAPVFRLQSFSDRGSTFAAFSSTPSPPYGCRSEPKFDKVLISAAGPNLAILSTLFASGLSPFNP